MSCTAQAMTPGYWSIEEAPSMYEMEGASSSSGVNGPIARPAESDGARHHHPAKPWQAPVDSVLTSRNGAIPGWLVSSKCPVASSGCRALPLASEQPVLVPADWLLGFPPSRASVSGGVDEFLRRSGGPRKSWTRT